MTNNHDYINITEAMLNDFRSLSVLNLAGNDFFCNIGISNFVKMADEGFDLNITDWNYGYGYFCRDLENSLKKKSFRDYSQDGFEIGAGYPPNEVEVINYRVSQNF